MNPQMKRAFFNLFFPGYSSSVLLLNEAEFTIQNLNPQILRNIIHSLNKHVLVNYFEALFLLSC